MKFTKEQCDVLWKFLYYSTEVTVDVHTPKDKIEELATELSVNAKKVKWWITNRKRTLKAEFFRKAAFQACGIPTLPNDLKSPAIPKPRKKNKRKGPGAPKKPDRFRARIDQSDTSFSGVPQHLNFKDTGMPSSVLENSEESSIHELWEPCNTGPPLKKIKTENVSSTPPEADHKDNPPNEQKIMIKAETFGMGEMTDGFKSTPEDGFPMASTRVDSPIGLRTPLFSSFNPFNSDVKSKSPPHIGSFDKISAPIPNVVLYPSFLSGLPNSQPNTPKTPLPILHPKLEFKTPLGRPPPFVAAVDNSIDFGLVHQPSCKTEPSTLLPRSKPRGNPVARVKAPGTRKKLTDNQQLILESFYAANLFTTKKIKEAVAQSAGLTYKQVRIWIMNRKVRDKKGLPPLFPQMPPSTSRGSSEFQRQQLTAFFEFGLLNEPTYRNVIAKATGLTEKQIKVWRMNFRAKLKKEGKLSELEA